MLLPLGWVLAIAVSIETPLWKPLTVWLSFRQIADLRLHHGHLLLDPLCFYFNCFLLFITSFQHTDACTAKSGEWRTLVLSSLCNFLHSPGPQHRGYSNQNVLYVYESVSKFNKGYNGALVWQKPKVHLFQFVPISSLTNWLCWRLTVCQNPILFFPICILMLW